MTVRKLDLMHSLFGKGEGKCGDCKHLVAYQYRGRRYRKCTIYGDTSSDASDWAKRWQACGCFNKDVPHKNVIRLVRSTAEKEEIQLDGQCEIWSVM